MELIEVAELYRHIKKHYPFFDAAVEKIKEDHEQYLKDFSADMAWHNIHQHIKTETVTPGIPHIRGRLGEQIERNRMRTETAEYFSRLDSWGNDSTPPDGYWERGRQLLRGETGV
ncbi:hypothetical protein [Paenibacillus solani]|uniref:hypothetical protein n=1 Tax=Paenibacillus solani TaxID=1705565 RepID=UPI003D2BB0E1